jgi:hypothetical protein
MEGEGRGCGSVYDAIVRGDGGMIRAGDVVKLRDWW